MQEFAYPPSSTVIHKQQAADAAASARAPSFLIDSDVTQGSVTLLHQK